MKTFTILLLSIVCTYLTGNAQTFTPISGTGFNYDVIANGNSTAAQSTNKTLVPNYCFYSKDFASPLNPQTAPLGLPTDRIINSAYLSEVTYQLADYGQPNVILVGIDSDIHSFIFDTPAAYSTLSLLLTNNYPSSICVEVNFDDKTRSFFNFNTKGWDNSNAAYAGCGVVNINTDQFSGTALTHNLYDYILTLSETDRVKKITSIKFSKSDIGTKLYVFAISGSNNSTYTGAKTTPVLEGEVEVDNDLRYTDTGGEWFCYANGITHKVTFTPKDATKKIRLMFDYFNTYCVLDVLKIYNGKEEDPSKLIARYAIGITKEEKEVFATNPDGALTCVFTTNEYYPHLGWSALVSQIDLKELDLKALSTSAASLTPPIDEAIPLTLKMRNYSITPIKGIDYSIRFTDTNNITIATAEGVDIEPGAIASIAIPVTINTKTTIKGEIVYTADQNPADNITTPITLSPLPQIKMDNGTKLIDNTLYNFFDEGGINYNYSDDHTLTLTIQPNAANKAVRVKFGIFKLETSYDYLKIYDGTSAVEGKLIGTFSGEEDIIPAALKEIKATNDYGALTFVFHSDKFTNKKGWEALIDLVNLVPESLSLSQPTAAFEAEGGIVIIDVTSNAHWTAIAGSEEWLAIETNQTGNNTLTITANSNPTSTPRTATVTVQTEYKEVVKTITISQAGAIATSANSQVAQADVVITPNPCTNGFTINAGHEPVLLTITNLTGSVVMKRYIVGSTFVHTENLQSGIYLVMAGNRVKKLQVK
jgi:hypothetical protein